MVRNRLLFLIEDPEPDRYLLSSIAGIESIEPGYLNDLKCVLENRLCRNPEFSTNCKLPVNGGDSACPPEPPLRFAIVSYYLLWNYRSRGGATAAGAEALHAVAPKER